MPFDAKEWQTLRNTHYNGPVWPHIVNDDHVCSRIWRLNDLVLIDAEERNLGLRNQIMACMALWGKIEQIWPKMTYNGPINVVVAIYDKLWPYLCLHYQFLPTPSLSGRFDHIAIKIPSKCKLARNGPHWYNMTCSREVCPFMAIFDASQLNLVNFEELKLNWPRMSFNDKEWQIMYNTCSNGPVWRHLVNCDNVCSIIWSMNYLVSIEADVRNVGFRYQVIQVLHSDARLNKYGLKWHIMVQYMF